MGVRKNALTLTATEKSHFIAALRQLKANARYDQQVVQHRGLFNVEIHNNPSFLPWHREFLHQLELDLKRFETYLPRFCVDATTTKLNRPEDHPKVFH